MVVYAGIGWEVPRLLELMPQASDWYFDIAAQVDMTVWARGRVVLVGDAAYCASPMSGQGSSLALIGAYVLAGELAAAGGDHEAAFAEYDRVMPPVHRREPGARDPVGGVHDPGSGERPRRALRSRDRVGDRSLHGPHRGCGQRHHVEGLPGVHRRAGGVTSRDVQSQTRC